MFLGEKTIILSTSKDIWVLTVWMCRIFTLSPSSSSPESRLTKKQNPKALTLTKTF